MPGSRSIECLYFLAESNDPQTVWLAQEHGFNLVEIRITLERSLKDWNPDTRPRAAEEGVLIRFAEPADIPVLQDIARTSYVDFALLFRPAFHRRELAILLCHLGQEKLQRRRGSCTGSSKGWRSDRLHHRAGGQGE